MLEWHFAHTLLAWTALHPVRPTHLVGPRHIGPFLLEAHFLNFFLSNGRLQLEFKIQTRARISFGVYFFVLQSFKPP